MSYEEDNEEVWEPLYICPEKFNEPRSKNSRYSFWTERVGFFSLSEKTLKKYGISRHSLNLRKNLRKNKFELFRLSYRGPLYKGKGNKMEIIFSGSFEDALKRILQEIRKMDVRLLRLYKKKTGKSFSVEPCRHTAETGEDIGCPIYEAAAMREDRD